jgi:hypothetical protein
MSSSIETELENILQQIINEYVQPTTTTTQPSSRNQQQQQLIDMLRTVINEHRYTMLDHRDVMRNAHTATIETLRTIREMFSQINTPTNVTRTNVTRTNVTPNVTRANVTPNVTRANVTPNVTRANVTRANVTRTNVTRTNVTPNVTRANVTPNVTRANVTPNVTRANVTRANVTPTNVTRANITTANATRRSPIDYLFTYMYYPPQGNVVVRPTQTQINNATEIITYTPEICTHTQCPITLEEFQTGDILRRIIECGHAFREPAINNWFTTSVRCPACRYDIRDYIAGDISANNISANNISANNISANNISANNITDISNNTQNDFTNIMSQTMQTNISNFIQNFLQNPDMSNNLSYYDASGNLIQMTIDDEFDYDLSVD